MMLSKRDFFWRLRPLGAGFSVYALVALFSVLGSLIVIFLDPIINSDGVLYLSVAEVCAQGSWADGQNLYRRPFYSCLIGFVANQGSWSVVIAARLVNILLCALLSMAFVGLVKELGGRGREAAISICLIILWPSFNEYKNYVIRDFGYWALTIFSLACLLKYQNTGKYAYVLLWVFTQSAAILFRPEAIFFVVALAPIIPFLRTPLKKYGFRSSRRSWIFFGLIVLMILMFVVKAPFVQEYIGSEALEYWGNLLGISHQFESRSIALEQSVLNQHSKEHAGPILAIGLLYMVIYSILSSIGVLVLLAFAAFFYKGGNYLQIKFLWLIYLLVGCSILVLFALDKYFVQARYAFLVAALILAILPSLIVRSGLFESSKRWRYFIVIIAAGLALDSFVSFGYSKKYIIDAAAWIDENTERDSIVLTNERALIYLTDRLVHVDNRFGQAKLSSGKYCLSGRASKYVVLIVKKNELKLKSELALNACAKSELAGFANGRGDQAIVYDSL